MAKDTKTKAAKKRYSREYKKATKAMKNLIKDYGPWDYGYIVDMMGIQLCHMADYYNQTYNVVAADEETPTRAEVATTAARLYLEYKHSTEVYDLTAPPHIERPYGELERLKTLFEYLSIYLPYLWD